jgi:hypothetical protein
VEVRVRVEVRARAPAAGSAPDAKEAVAVRPRDHAEGAPGEDGRAGRRDGNPPSCSGTGPSGGAESGGTDAAEVIAEAVRDVPPAEVPRRLCAVAVRLLPLRGASVSLRAEGMPVQLGASDATAARLGEVQATLGDGPCLHAAAIGAPVLATDLADGPEARRWPVFAQQAAEAGVQAVYSFPLGNDAVCVGTLDLYGAEPRVLSPPELRTAHLVAGVMTLALMALPHAEDDEEETSWLSALAADHDEVQQAIGMIMAQLGIDADEALARLRAHAFARGRTALDVAHEVITQRKRFDRD